MTAIKKNKASVKIIAATTFMSTTAIIALIFVSNDLFNEWAFAFALLFSIVGFVLISSMGNVLFLRFWNLELKFREIQKTEASVKEVAIAVLELAESNEAGLKPKSWDKDRYEKAKEQMRKLIR